MDLEREGEEAGETEGEVGRLRRGETARASFSRKVETAESRSKLWLSRKKIASSLEDAVISINVLRRSSLIRVSSPAASFSIVSAFSFFFPAFYLFVYLLILSPSRSLLAFFYFFLVLITTSYCCDKQMLTKCSHGA